MKKSNGEDRKNMTIYVCLDDKNGMLFNGRRQSRDARVLEDIAKGLPGVLTIDPFSEKLVAAAQIPYGLAGDTPDRECHFFLENRDPDTLLSMADCLVIYRWNRHYPGDTRWNADPEALGFHLAETTEFPGKSHEKITKEVYVR